MNDEIIVLDEPSLLQINGADNVISLICNAAGAAVGAAFGGAGGAAAGALAGGVAADILNNLATINNALGPPGSFNPYGNPIACEYGGY